MEVDVGAGREVTATAKENNKGIGKPHTRAHHSHVHFQYLPTLYSSSFIHVLFFCLVICYVQDPDCPRDLRQGYF